MNDGQLPHGPDAVRARLRQMEPQVIAENHRFMMRMGPGGLVRVVPLAGPMPQRAFLTGYITTLPALSGLTPEEMRVVLGLRLNDLAQGAAVYGLDRVPPIGSFLPRGYTTLPDGRPLRRGAIVDADGYWVGHGAWQATLIEAQPATLIATVPAGERWEPGPHPKYRIG